MAVADATSELERSWINPKRILVTLILGALILGFAAIVGLGILHEVPGTNSYALLADGWLHGRLDTDRCFDGDCALFDGRTYVIFPPMPAVIALPFVAIFGAEFRFFMPLTLVAIAGAGWLWWRIASRETSSRDLAILIVVTILFATPLAYALQRGDHIWSFAQAWGFLFSTAAIYSALVRRNALLVGLFIGMAFLCRQMTIFYLPLLYVLMLDKGTPVFRIDLAAIRRVAVTSLFPVLAVAIYFAYNYVRFGSITETGYTHIFPAEWDDGHTVAQFLQYRVRELGIFSPEYFLFNFIYMFIAGPHIEFAGRYLTEMGRFDDKGASLFLVTPVLLFALLGKWDRAFWFGLATCALILGLTLFYHSNGFSQYSTQRYALDWLPILMLFVARGLKPALVPAVSLLSIYAVGVTMAMIVFAGLGA